MRIKKYAIVCFALIISSLLVPGFIVKSVAVDQAHEQGKFPQMEKFRMKMMLEFLQQNHPELLDTIDNIKAMERRASELAREFKLASSDEDGQPTLDRIRRLLEDATRQKFELTGMALEGLQQKLDEFRRRHHRQETRFDEIIDNRLRSLLH